MTKFTYMFNIGFKEHAKLLNRLRLLTLYNRFGI